MVPLTPELLQEPVHVLLLHEDMGLSASVAFGVANGDAFGARPVSIALMPLDPMGFESAHDVAVDLQESAFGLLREIRVVSAADALKSFDLVVLPLPDASFTMTYSQLLALEHGLRWTGQRQIHVSMCNVHI